MAKWERSQAGGLTWRLGLPGGYWATVGRVQTLAPGSYRVTWTTSLDPAQSRETEAAPTPEDAIQLAKAQASIRLMAHLRQSTGPDVLDAIQALVGSMADNMGDA